MLYNNIGIMGSEGVSFTLHMPINHVIVLGQQGVALLSDDGKRHNRYCTHHPSVRRRIFIMQRV